MNERPEKIAAELAKIIGGKKVLADIFSRAAYSSDASIYRIVPLCVAMPANADDVAAVIRYAAEKNIPVTARGAASGVAGESLTSGISLDTARYMNKIIRIENEGQIIICEPGAVLDELNNRLKKYGRQIGPDPSSSNRATTGGCTANNATGAHFLQYGYFADHVLKIRAVLADASTVELVNDFEPEKARDSAIAETAEKCIRLLADKQEIIAAALPRTKRNRSGYNIAGVCHNGKIDMARLVAGSEGTLAVFTEITLKTVPIPPVKALLQLEFDSLDTMSQAVAPLSKAAHQPVSLWTGNLSIWPLSPCRNIVTSCRRILKRCCWSSTQARRKNWWRKR